MEIQTVRSEPNVRQKYVVVRALYRGIESLVLWGNPDVAWHKDIVEGLADAGYEIVEVLGGGWMLPKPDEGKVYVWGKSDRFGPAPMNLVRMLLVTDVIEEEPQGA